MTTYGVRVVKVGGSLLDDPQLPHALRCWLAAQSSRRNVLVAGGGAWVELLRDASQRFDLSETVCHWLCIDLMSVTAELLARMTGLDMVRDWRVLKGETADDAPLPPPIIFDCGDFLRFDERCAGGQALAQNWGATSDSIAARLAAVIDADELALLKSALPPQGATRATCAGAYVDAEFPRAAAGDLRVRCINLRRPDFPEVDLPDGGADRMVWRA